MTELKLLVPTFYGHAAESTTRELPEFGEPLVPVLIRRADGVRIVLGSHDYEDMNFPDIQVERRPNGWAIFLHPLPGCDPSGYVYFLDDGRCFVLPEREICGTVPIRCLDPGDQIPLEVDALAVDCPRLVAVRGRERDRRSRHVLYPRSIGGHDAGPSGRRQKAKVKR